MTETRPVLSSVDGVWFLTDKSRNYHRELTLAELRHLMSDAREAIDVEAGAVLKLEQRIRDGLLNGNEIHPGHTPHSTMKAIVEVTRWVERHQAEWT